MSIVRVRSCIGKAWKPVHGGFYTLLACMIAGHYWRLVVATVATVRTTVYAVRADCVRSPRAETQLTRGGLFASGSKHAEIHRNIPNSMSGLAKTRGSCGNLQT